MRKKVHGKSQILTCPFCSSRATTRNKEGVPVCHKHNRTEFGEMKCACGSWLELKISKYGPFFVCINCGAVAYKRGLEINGYPIKSVDEL